MNLFSQFLGFTNSTQKKYETNMENEMSLKKSEKIVIGNEAATTSDDQFGEVSSIHIIYDEPADKEASISANETMASTVSQTVVSCNEITVL